MKRLILSIAIALSFCGCSFGATPSFYSFDTNDFTVTPSLSNPLTIHSRGSGGTNVFNTIIVTNLYITTNTYVIVSGDTNAVGLWVYNGEVLQPVRHADGTNQFQIADATGWTGAGTNAFMDDGTFSAVAVINPTDGAIPVRVSQYELGDLSSGTGYLHNDGSNGFSWYELADLWTTNATTLYPKVSNQPLVFTSWMVGTNTQAAFGGDATNGESFVSIRVVESGDVNYNNIYLATSQQENLTDSIGYLDVSTYTNRVLSTLGVYTNSVGWSIQSGIDPDSGIDVAKLFTEYTANGQVVGAFHPSTADASDAVAWRFGTVNPFELGSIMGAMNNGTNVFLVGAQGGMFIGPNSQAAWGGSLLGEALISARIVALGDPNFNQVEISANDDLLGSNSGRVSFSTTTNSGSFSTAIQDANGSSGIFNDANTSSGLLVRQEVRAHGTNFVTLFSDGSNGQIIFGPGTTNVLFRDGTALRYTNGATANVNFEIDNGAGKSTAINISTGTGGLQTSEPLLVFTANGTSATLDTANSALRPNNPAALSLGTDGAPWLNLYLTNKIFFGPGTTNVLYRSAGDLVYTNGSSGVFMRVLNGAGKGVDIGGSVGNEAVVTAVNTTALTLSNGSDQLTIFGGAVTPGVSTLGLGSSVSQKQWGGLWLTNDVAISTNYIYFGTNRMSVIGTDLYWNGTKLN